MNILITSNGKGEDSIAATVLSKLKELISASNLHFTINIKALPIVGDGNSYKKIGIPIINPQPMPPSGGFPLQNFNSFILDFKKGILHSLRKHIKSIKDQKPDIIIAVGDILPIILSLPAKSEIIHIGTAFSLNLRNSIFLENWLLKKCSLVFTRDQQTSTHFQKKGINSIYLGNPMMDDPNLKINPNSHLALLYKKCIKTKKTIIGLIPSSRPDAYDNLKIILQTVTKIPQKNNLIFVVSLAPNLKKDRFMNIISSFNNDLEVLISEDSLGTVIYYSKLLIGMTGTGNEQVIGMEKPLILLKGNGPQSTKKRLNHYQKLLGASVFIPKGTKTNIGKEIGHLISDKNRLEEMTKIGNKYMGSAGAANKIAQSILDLFKSYC